MVTGEHLGTDIGTGWHLGLVRSVGFPDIDLFRVRKRAN